MPVDAEGVFVRAGHIPGPFGTMGDYHHCSSCGPQLFSNNGRFCLPSELGCEIVGQNQVIDYGQQSRKLRCVAQFKIGHNRDIGLGGDPRHADCSFNAEVINEAYPHLANK